MLQLGDFKADTIAGAQLPEHAPECQASSEADM